MVIVRMVVMRTKTIGLRKGWYCRNLIKKPWAFIGVPYMNPTILGL